MKILIIAPTSIPIPCPGYGGTQRYCLNLAKEFSALNHEVALAGPKGSKHNLYGIIETSIKPIRKPSKATIQKYLNEIKKNCPFTPDIINNHCTLDREITEVFPGIPLVSTIHASENARMPENGEIVFVSNFSRNHYKKPNNKFIYNPIEMEKYEFCPTHDNYLVFISKLNWPIKGAEDAIKIAKHKKMNLIMCGPDLNFSLWLKSLTWPWSKFKIKFIGSVSGQDKSNALKNAKALLSPSRLKESFGRAPVEANACGTPAIVLNSGALSEVIEDGKTGFVCNTIEEMIEAIDKVDALDPLYCRQFVEKNYHTRVIAEQHIKYYQECIDKNQKK